MNPGLEAPGSAPAVVPSPSPTSPTDEEIVARVVSGEVALFEQLMRRHNSRVYRAARAIVRDDSEAEDVMQDAYVRAYEHLSEFEAGSAPTQAERGELLAARADLVPVDVPLGSSRRRCPARWLAADRCPRDPLCAGFCLCFPQCQKVSARRSSGPQ